MTGQVLTILFKDAQAYIVNGLPMQLNQLRLVEKIAVPREVASWVIEVLNYIDSEKKLFCKIIEYNLGFNDFDENQKRISHQLKEVRFITFQSIDTAGLLRTLPGIQPITTKSEALIQTYPNEEMDNEQNKSTPEINADSMELKVRQNSRVDPSEEELNPHPQSIKSKIRQKLSLSETFYVPIKDVKFTYGGVIVYKALKKFPYPLEFFIPNDDIREEFDAVKNYFANALGKKKIEVTVRIEINNDEIISKEASSPDIDRINNRMIESVKFEIVRTPLKKKISVEIDKSLFTMDEYFEDLIDKSVKSNIFYNDERKFLEDIVSISNTLHYKHLRYLSSRHLYHIMKLRFVLKPFSFIFLLEGEKKYHIVWETLNTKEATYIWHVSKDKNTLRMALKRIENILNIVRLQGKTEYILNTEDQVTRIYHDYSDFIEGFVKWKGEIESILV